MQPPPLIAQAPAPEPPALAPAPPLKVLEYHVPPPGGPGAGRWSWVGRWAAALAWAACVAGTALIFWEVESVMLTGAALATLGIALLVAGLVARRTPWAVLGSAHVAVCGLFVALVNLRDWGPREAQAPFEAMSVLYTLASAAPSWLAFRRHRSGGRAALPRSGGPPAR